MPEALSPEMEARQGELDKEQDPWRIAEVLKEMIPTDQLEEGIKDFDSKYSLHGDDGIIYKDKAHPYKAPEQVRIGTPEQAMGYYIRDVRAGYDSFAEAWRQEPFSVLRIAVIAEWAKRQGYSPRET